MEHLNGSSKDDRELNKSSEKKYKDLNKLLMSEYIIMALVISVLMYDRSFFHSYLIFLKTNQSSVNTKVFERPYQQEAATSDHAMLSPDYTACRTPPIDEYYQCGPTWYFLDLIFGNMPNAVYVLLSSSDNDYTTESGAHDLSYLIVIVGAHLILVSIVELQCSDICLDDIIDRLMQLFANDTVIENLYRELKPTVVNHNLSIRKQSIANPHLDDFCRDFAQYNHSKNGNGLLGNKRTNRWTKPYLRSKTLFLLLVLFSLLNVTNAQLSCSHQCNKYVDLFTESDDLMFSNEMMQKAGCSYHYSSATQLDMPQPMSPIYETAHFCNSGNVYLNLHICEPKILQVQHGNSGIEYRESNGSSREKYVYMCITSVWSCGSLVMMAIFSFIFDVGKTSGLSLFVLGFNLAKHDMNLQPFRSITLNDEESEVIEVLALYDHPTTNYPVSIKDDYFGEPSSSMQKKSNSELAYTNYKPFYVANLESYKCFREADDSSTPNGRMAIGYEYGITRINDASRTESSTEKLFTTGHQVMIMTSVLMVVLGLVALLITYAVFVADKAPQCNKQNNSDNSVLHFGNRNQNLYRLSTDVSQIELDKCMSQIKHHVRRRFQCTKLSSEILVFETVKELSGQQTARQKETEGFHKQLPSPIQEVIKNADHPVMNSGGQDKYMGCSVDVIDCKQKNQSELAI